MFAEPWNVIKYHPGTQPLHVQKAESINTLDDDCDFELDDEYDDDDDEDYKELVKVTKKAIKNKNKPFVKFIEVQTQKKSRASTRKKVKDMGAAVGTALKEVKGRFN